MKVRLLAAETYHADGRANGQTGVTKIIRKFVNVFRTILVVFLCGINRLT